MSSQMTLVGYEAMVREHFSLKGYPKQATVKVTDLIEFARKCYELGERDGARDARPAVPEPPKGIGNYLLECGHVTQAKVAFVRNNLVRLLWCPDCKTPKLITQAPDEEVRT